MAMSLQRIRISTFFTALLLCCTSDAKMKISHYELNEEQIKILRMMESKGKDEVFLKKFANAMSNRNKRKKEYVPPHTRAVLEAVADWAQGGAFAYYAEQAGYKFLFEKYDSDCPDKAVFGFGYATAKKYFVIDVIGKASKLISSMGIANGRLSEKEFAVKYWQRAVSLGFDKYLVQCLKRDAEAYQGPCKN